MTSSPGWGWSRRVAFRFGFAVGVLLVFPFPFGAIPKTDSLAEAMHKPLDWATHWFAQLRLPDPPSVFNGSGDRTFDYVQLLLIVLLAVLAAIIWSILDRRRIAYPRLAAASIVVLRYVLAWVMLSYGFSKILRQQFSDPQPLRLAERIGDMSPMGMLWTFMGSSAPYTIFAGLAEAVGGALLLWRRTAVIGALIIIPVMVNVVVLNLCYDVPVKLYSTQLVIMALVIAGPSLGRLLGAALGRAVPEVPPRVRMSPRWERIRLVAALAMSASIAIGVYLEISSSRGRGDRVHELFGIWTVDSFTADGVERPPLTTDAERWRNCLIGARSAGITAMTGTQQTFAVEVDASAGTIALTDRQTKAKEIWRYTRRAPDHLAIDGVHGGKYLHVALHLEPDGLLLTRGFHWINEVPFNR